LWFSMTPSRRSRRCSRLYPNRQRSLARSFSRARMAISSDRRDEDSEVPQAVARPASQRRRALPVAPRWRGLSLRLPNRTGPAQNEHAGGGRNRCARTSLTSPARKPAGFCCPGGLCAAARQFIKYGCSQSFARYFSPRLLFGVGAMKFAFKVVFAIALILGLVSTVAANVSLVTAPQVSTRN
jgi:hypothetical protein